MWTQSAWVKCQDSTKHTQTYKYCIRTMKCEVEARRYLSKKKKM